MRGQTDAFTAAQMIADRYGFSRAELDSYALEHRRAAAAAQAGAFRNEIVSIAVLDADGGSAVHATDKGIRYDATLDGIGSIKPLQKRLARLTHAVRARGKRPALQTMFEGGRIGNATIVEAM